MNLNQLHEFLRKNLELAVNDYGMIAPGDRILIGLSGGADSFSLLELLSSKKILIPNDIFLLVVHIDLGFSSESEKNFPALREYCRQRNLPLILEKTDYGPMAHREENKENPCFICSRLRRKRLFELAAENNCTKIALGHHKDDILETFLLNIFFGREISTMLPKQDFFKEKIYIIRPLAYLEENIIKEYSHLKQFPVFPNYCQTGKTSKRAYIKTLLEQMEQDYRGIKKNIYRAMKHVKPEYLLPPPEVNPR